jgi:integrase
VTRHFQLLAARAGLRRIRLHDLRHGAASLRLAAGVPIAVVSKILGHSSIAVTADIYSHLLKGVGRQAAKPPRPPPRSCRARRRTRVTTTANSDPVETSSEQQKARSEVVRL